MTSDGSSLIVVGTTGDPGRPVDYLTIAYDAASGSPRWISRYDGSGFHDRAEAVAVSPLANLVYVTGQSGGGRATLAYDLGSGALVWVGRYDGQALDIAVSPDGARVFVTGGDFTTVAYDAASGAELWTARSSSTAKRIAVSADGLKVYVTGSSAAPTWLDFLTVAYDARDGAVLWERRYDGPAHLDDSPYGMAISPDGLTLVVAGFSSGFPHGLVNDPEFFTIAYDAADGNVRWVQRFGGPGFWGLANDVAVDSSRAYVTGTNAFGTISLTVSYDLHNGQELWSALRHGGTVADAANLVRVDALRERVYVSGSSDGLDLSRDWVTVAYDSATGVELWVRRYDSGGGTPQALALTPGGDRVFVSGRAGGAATVAYSTAK